MTKTYDERERNIRKLVLNIMEVVSPDSNLSDLKDEVKLRDQLELDSMDFLDIVMELRKRHKIEVPKEEYKELSTLEGCINYLNPKFPHNYDFTT